jgi:uncharacterized protein YceK
MKYLVIIIITIFLNGCSLLPKLNAAKPKFPEPIKELTEPCPDLKQIEGDKVTITDLLKSVVNNYTLYYQCSVKNHGWNEWYNKQKKIFED